MSDDNLTPQQRVAIQDRLARDFLEGFKLVVCRMDGHLRGELATDVVRVGEFETVGEALKCAQELRDGSKAWKEPNTRYFIERKGKKGHRDPGAVRHERNKRLDKRGLFPP